MFIKFMGIVNVVLNVPWNQKLTLNWKKKKCKNKLNPVFWGIKCCYVQNLSFDIRRFTSKNDPTSHADVVRTIFYRLLQSQDQLEK